MGHNEDNIVHNIVHNDELRELRLTHERIIERSIRALLALEEANNKDKTLLSVVRERVHDRTSSDPTKRP